MHSFALEEQILFEDNHLIVVNKKAGELVQGDKTGDTPLSEKIKEYLKHKYHKPGEAFIGVVHRLDRPTTGVVVFAKTSKALARLNRQFAEKTTQKTYWALVEKSPLPATGILQHFLKKNAANNTSKAFEKEIPQSKRAKLRYQLLKTLNHYFLLEVEPETGRHHQIRVQLSAMGWPIKGDLKYGAARSNKDGSICLHARSLCIEHPVSREKMTFTAPVPDLSPWPECR